MHDLQGTQLPSLEWKQRSSNMIQTACTYMVWMARRGEKVPLAMVWSLLSYKERRFRLCRSWKASTRRQFILLAFNNLFDQIVVGLKCSTSWTYLQVSVLEKKTQREIHFFSSQHGHFNYNNLGTTGWRFGVISDKARLTQLKESPNLVVLIHLFNKKWLHIFSRCRGM